MALLAVPAASLTILHSQPAMLACVPFLSIPGYFAWRISRHRHRLAEWGFWVASSISTISVAYLCTYDVSVSGYVAAVLITLITLPPTIGFGVAWEANVQIRVDKRAVFGLAPLVVGVLSVLPLSMITTFWPLRVAFLVSRPALNRIADRVEAGEQIRRPEWAGLFLILKTKSGQNEGDLALIVDDDPSGKSGFVRLHAPDGNSPLVNLDFDEVMDARWRFQFED